MPPALLSDVVAEALPSVIRRMEERMKQEAGPEEAKTLGTAAGVLIELWYPRELTEQLLRGVRAMKEAVIHRAILKEGEARGRAKGEARGRLAEVRAMLLRLGRRRFGEPAAQARAEPEAIFLLKRLERLTKCLLDVEN